MQSQLRYQHYQSQYTKLPKVKGASTVIKNKSKSKSKSKKATGASAGGMTSGADFHLPPTKRTTGATPKNNNSNNNNKSSSKNSKGHRRSFNGRPAVVPMELDLVPIHANNETPQEEFMLSESSTSGMSSRGSSSTNTNGGMDTNGSGSSSASLPVSPSSCASHVPETTKHHQHKQHQHHSDEVTASADTLRRYAVVWLRNMLMPLHDCPPLQPGDASYDEFVNESRLDIRAFVRIMMTNSGAPKEALPVAVSYLYRLHDMHPTLEISNVNVRRLFVVALILANKHLNDLPYSNRYFSELCGYRLRQLNTMEREMLRLLDYSLECSDDDYVRFSNECINMHLYKYKH